MELETQLSAITRAGATMADGIRGLADDYSASLNDTIEKINHQTNNLQTETERTNKIRVILLQSISEVNQMLDGRPLTDAEVRKLAI